MVARIGFFLQLFIQLLFALIILLLIPQSVFAVTVTFKNVPSTINAEPFNVDVAISGTTKSTIYGRVDLYKEKEGTPNYFGETYNGNTWQSISDGLQYFPISISSEGTGSATLQAKFGIPSTNDYSGPGTYKLKVRGYTSSSSYDFSNPVDVQITVALPTPTPTSSPSPTPTPSATPHPTSSPRPTVTPSPTPKKSSPSPSNKLISPSPEPSDDILGVTDEVVPTASPQEATGSSKIIVPNNLPFGFLLISFGILLSGGAGFLAYKKVNK